MCAGSCVRTSGGIGWWATIRDSSSAGACAGRGRRGTTLKPANARASPSATNDMDNVVRGDEIRTSAELGILFVKSARRRFKDTETSSRKNQILGITKESGI